MRFRQHLLAPIGAMATCGLWKRLHRVLLTELRRRGQLDLARAFVGSASLRALRGGQNWTEHYRSP